MAIHDDSIYLFYVVPFAVVLSGAFFYAWWLGRSDKAAHGAYAALHSPSVTQARNAFDRRVAMAVRAAKLGFVECAGCGFANAHRTACCVLCGVALAETAGARKRFWQRRSGDRAGGTNSPSSDALDAVVAVGVSERQQRIRRRKEWLREVDEEAHVVWRHVAPAASAGSRDFAFYVLQSAAMVGTSLEDPADLVVRHELRSSTISAHSTSIQSEPTVEVVIDTAEAMRTITNVARALTSKLDTTTAVVVNVVTADATHVAYASLDTGNAASALSILDSIRSAQLDFPTKLAHFVTSMASRFTRTGNTGSAGVSRLAINRATLLTDSLDALATLSPAAATGAVRVEFLGEQGIDAGGVYREWFLLLNEQIVKPSAGIFVCVDERGQTFYLRPLSRELLGEHHLAHIFAAGRLLGRALLEGNVTGFHLALPLLKIILGLPVGFDDLAYFDPDVHKNLQWLMDNEGVDMLGLDFTVTQILPDGTTREVDLVPGGSQIDVTDANKHEFVERKLQYLLFDSVAPQLFAFLRGLYEVVPAELLVLFDAEELDYVLSGSDEVDVEDWERNTVTSKNLAYYPADELFWEVVRSLTPDQRRSLLQFATGSTRVPPGGFAALTSNDGQLCLFTLRGVTARETRGYLHSHACFNRVDLPMHKSVKEMRRAVLAAIAGESIGFTTD